MRRSKVIGCAIVLSVIFGMSAMVWSQGWFTEPRAMLFKNAVEFAHEVKAKYFQFTTDAGAGKLFTSDTDGYAGWETIHAAGIEVGVVYCDTSAELIAAASPTNTDAKIIVTSANTTLSAPLTIPAGKTYTALPGAVLTTTAVNTLTFSMGSRLQDNGSQMLSAASGEVVFAAGVVDEVRPEWWGAVHDGATSDYDELTCAITAAAPIGATVTLTPSTGGYLIGQTDIIDLPAGANIRGEGYYSFITRTVVPTVDTTPILRRETAGGGKNVLSNFRLVGPAPNPIVSATEGKAMGIRLRDGANIRIEKMVFENFNTDAVSIRGSSATTDPSEIWLTDNLIQNCWNGLFVKYGEDNVHIEGNTFKTMAAGAMVVDDSSSADLYAPQLNNVVIANNVVDGFSSLFATSAIAVQGTQGLVVANNIIRNGGNATYSGGGISVTSGGRAALAGPIPCYGPVIRGNTIDRVSGYGILSAASFADISGNTILSFGYGANAGTPVGINLYYGSDGTTSTYATDNRVHDNIIALHPGDKARMSVGVNVEHASNTDNWLYNNTIQDCTAQWSDTGTRTVWNGILHVEFGTTRSSSGTGADTLKTITLPAGYLLKYGIHNLRIVASGDKTGAAGNKTITFNWGTQAHIFHPAANDTLTWMLDVNLDLRTTSAQAGYVCGQRGTVNTYMANIGTSQDLTAALTINLVGECADGADTVGNSVLRLHLN